MSRFCDVIGYNPDSVVGYLQEAACYLKTILTATTAYRQCPFAQQRHERRVPRQNPEQAVVGRRDDRVRRSVEDRLLGRNDRDVHQELAIFFAAATTSSIPPAM